MNKISQKIGFIGAGKMAQAIMKGIISAGFFERADIFAAEPNPDASDKVSKEFGIKVFDNAEELVKSVDIIVFSVKPFVVKDVIAEIKDVINADKKIISIAAGISTEFIQKELGVNIPVLRVMPNTPALVNAGMSAVCKGTYADEKDLEFVYNLFSCLGKVIKIEETQMDIVTAISGSSPAFYYYFINEIAKSAQKMGFDYKLALLSAAQSALGSAKMIMETGVEPEILIDNVTTKGGTTEAGMNVLKSAQTDKIIDDVIKATAEKSAILGK